MGAYGGPEAQIPEAGVFITYPKENQVVSSLTPTITWDTSGGIYPEEIFRLRILGNKGLILEVMVPNLGSYVVPPGKLLPNSTYTLQLFNLRMPELNDTVNFKTAIINPIEKVVKESNER